MRVVAFVFGLCIAAVGTSGILAPSILVWIAQHFTTSGAFYLIAAVRVAFGLVLISAAPTSRAPMALSVLGYVVLVVGMTTALTALLGIERAQAIIQWWLEQGSGVVRLTGVPLLALGGFVAFTCAPDRRAAWSSANLETPR